MPLNITAKSMLRLTNAYGTMINEGTFNNMILEDISAKNLGLDLNIGVLGAAG